MVLYTGDQGLSRYSGTHYTLYFYSRAFPLNIEQVLKSPFSFTDHSFKWEFDLYQQSKSLEFSASLQSFFQSFKVDSEMPLRYVDASPTRRCISNSEILVRNGDASPIRRCFSDTESLQSAQKLKTSKGWNTKKEKSTNSQISY